MANDLARYRAANFVFACIRLEDDTLDLGMVSDDAAGWVGWEAYALGCAGHGASPWEAIEDLAKALKERT